MPRPIQRRFRQFGLNQARLSLPSPGSFEVPIGPAAASNRLGIEQRNGLPNHVKMANIHDIAAMACLACVSSSGAPHRIDRPSATPQAFDLGSRVFLFFPPLPRQTGNPPRIHHESNPQAVQIGIPDICGNNSFGPP